MEIQNNIIKYNLKNVFLSAVPPAEEKPPCQNF